MYLNILHTLSAGLVGFVDDDLVDQFVHDLRLSCQILSCRFCKREVLQIVGILNGEVYSLVSAWTKVIAVIVPEQITTAPSKAPNVKIRFIGNPTCFDLLYSL